MRLGFDIAANPPTAAEAPEYTYAFWGLHADAVAADAHLASIGATPAVGDYVAVNTWQGFTGVVPFQLRWGDSTTSAGKVEPGWVVFRAFMNGAFPGGALPTGGAAAPENVWAQGDESVGSAEWVVVWSSPSPPTPSTESVATLYFWDATGGQWSEAPFTDARAWNFVQSYGDLPDGDQPYVRQGDTGLVISGDPVLTGGVEYDDDVWKWRWLIVNVFEALPTDNIFGGAVALVGEVEPTDAEVWMWNGATWVWRNAPEPAPDYKFWGDFPDEIALDAELASLGATPAIGDYARIGMFYGVLVGQITVRWGDDTTGAPWADPSWQVFDVKETTQPPFGPFGSGDGVWWLNDLGVRATWLSTVVDPTPSTEAVRQYWVFNPAGVPSPKWDEVPLGDGLVWDTVPSFADLPDPGMNYVRIGDVAKVEIGAGIGAVEVTPSGDWFWRWVQVETVGDLPSDAWGGATALVGTGAFIDSEVYVMNPDTGLWVWRTELPPSDSRTLLTYTTFIERFS